jgi:hypothetical protein
MKVERAVSAEKFLNFLPEYTASYSTRKYADNAE